MLRRIIFFFAVIYLLVRNVPFFTSPVLLTTLDNNLTIITQEVNKLPLINIDIFIKSGTTQTENSVRYEYILRYLLFSERHNLSHFISERGGNINSTILPDMTRHTLTFHKKYLDEVLSLILSSLSPAEITDKQLNEAVEKAQQEIKQKNQIPELYLSNLLFQNAYKFHPYQRGLFPESILRPKREDLQEYIDRYLSPANIVLVILGDVKSEEAQNTAKNIFDGERFRFIDREKIKEPPLELKQVIIEKSTLASNSSYLGIVFRAPSVKNVPDVYIMDVILTLLGEGITSRLHTRLVEEKKICEKITAEFLTQKDEGLFKIIARCSPQKIDEAKENILKEIFKLKSENISPSELQKAKNLIEVMVTLDTETLSGRASHLGFYEVIDTYKFALTYQEEIDKVTSRQIKEFASRVFGEKNYLVGILKSREENNDK